MPLPQFSRGILIIFRLFFLKFCQKKHIASILYMRKLWKRPVRPANSPSSQNSGPAFPRKISRRPAILKKSPFSRLTFRSRFSSKPAKPQISQNSRLPTPAASRTRPAKWEFRQFSRPHRLTQAKPQPANSRNSQKRGPARPAHKCAEPAKRSIFGFSRPPRLTPCPTQPAKSQNKKKYGPPPTGDSPHPQEESQNELRTLIARHSHPTAQDAPP